MVKDESTSNRCKIKLGFGSSTSEGPPSGGDSTNSATKTESSDGFALTLGAGIQKNRGKGRLRGIYGAEAHIMFASGSDDKYTYAVAVDAAHDPSGSGRNTEVKGGGMFGIGVNGFIGAEYFFAPKMSLSAEYGWGIDFTSNGEGETSSEDWDQSANNGNGGIKATTTKGQKSSSFSIGNANPGAYLIFHCYF